MNVLLTCVQNALVLVVFRCFSSSKLCRHYHTRDPQGFEKCILFMLVPKQVKTHSNLYISNNMEIKAICVKQRRPKFQILGSLLIGCVI